MSTQQMTVYDLVNGSNSVSEIILESPLIEFETCKALADLVDRGIIREATSDEVARHAIRDAEPQKVRRRGVSLPWLALPVAMLLAFGLSMVLNNPWNPGLQLRQLLWDGHILEIVSWQRMGQLSRVAEAHFFLHGLYPQSVTDLITAARSVEVTDPWGRPYRFQISDGRLWVTGTDTSSGFGRVPAVSRYLAWEGDAEQLDLRGQPGVRLID
jgi:hypothetical protein